MKVTVILPAAGLGTRMKLGREKLPDSPPPDRTQIAEKTGTSRKQFMMLDGSPILVHTLRKFAASDRVTEIVVALRGDDMAWFSGVLAAEHITKPIRLVEGGDSRHHSVENALATLDPDVDLVAIHDAVRPFVDLELIDRVILEAAQSGAAILGIVPVDTVKQVHLQRIRATIARDRLVLAQTPQVFRLDLLRRAFEKARADAFTGTDESSLVERLEEVEVAVVAGNDRNIKITRPTDMELAKLFLAEEAARR
jgi:2-C-methyl-D-erythritol 4-phosphate cytidylyltransferase